MTDPTGLRFGSDSDLLIGSLPTYGQDERTEQVLDVCLSGSFAERVRAYRGFDSNEGDR